MVDSLSIPLLDNRRVGLYLPKKDLDGAITEFRVSAVGAVAEWFLPEIAQGCCTQSPDQIVVGPDGKWNVWPMDGSGLKPIPNLDSKYYITGWTPDGTSLYALSGHSRDRTATVYRVNVVTGKMELWKTFGEGTKVGLTGVGGPRFSRDGKAYAYVYSQALSVAYIVRGLR